MKPHRRSTAALNRAGFTLIETLVAIALSGIALTTIGVTLHVLNRTNHAIRSQVASSMLVPRVAMQLRRDAHQASSFDIGADGDPSLLVLNLERDGRIEYRLFEQRLVRQAFQGGEQVHQEPFALPELKIRWEVAEDLDNLLRLQLTWSSDQGTTMVEQVEVIEAAVGGSSAVASPADSSQPLEEDA